MDYTIHCLSLQIVSFIRTQQSLSQIYDPTASQKTSRSQRLTPKFSRSSEQISPAAAASTIRQFETLKIHRFLSQAPQMTGGTLLPSRLSAQ